MGNEHYKNLSLADIVGEEWKDIKDFEGYYQVSNMGRVKSLERELYTPKGTIYIRPAKILKQYLLGNKNCKSFCIKLTINKIRKHYTVSRLVAEQILGLSLESNAIIYKNNNRLDVRAINLDSRNLGDTFVEKRKSKKSNKYRGVSELYIMYFHHQAIKIHESFKTELEAAKKYDYYVKKYKLNRELNFPDDK